MDEYPEYDFYNSREECDGKEGRGGEGRREGGDGKGRGEGQDREADRARRKETGKKAGYRGEMTDKSYKERRGEKEKEEVKTRVKFQMLDRRQQAGICWLT